MIGSLRDISLQSQIQYDFMMNKLNKAYTDTCGRTVTIHLSRKQAENSINNKTK